MAAGLSMHESAISELRERLNENAVLSEEDLTEKVTIDIPMPVMYATETFIEELNLLAPFGIGNPRPLFAQKDLKIRSLQVLGKNRNVVRLKLETLQEAGRAPVITDAICFGEGDTIEAELSKKESVSIVYYPEFNEYLGRRNMQIVIRDYQ